MGSACFVEASGQKCLSIADGGAHVGAVTGSISVSATTAGNNINISGANQSASRLITDQANTADVTQASKFTAYGSSYLSATTATATGNTLSVANEGPLTDLTSNQWNTSYVRGQAEATSYQFGGAQTNAYAVGNASQVVSQLRRQQASCSGLDSAPHTIVRDPHRDENEP